MPRPPIALVTLLALAGVAAGQEGPDDELRPLLERSFETQAKGVDDLLWYEKVRDVARLEKVRIPSSRPIRMANKDAPGAGNPLILPVYTFVPKAGPADKKRPLIVYVHGGVHGNFDTSNANIVRELIGRGYVVVAPEYRGSTGYGRDLYNQIDYGGAEIDDSHDTRDWAVSEMPEVDPKRVGIIGWSHGGFHALLNIFRWPDDYQVAYAGVPVSDLVQRMGYKPQKYRDLFASFIGGQAKDNPQEYLERSPFYHAAKLRTPLLIHTTTNDEDVHVMEVRHLMDALKAAGKTFESKVYEDAPGGHAFNRIDSRLARESRAEIYAFLARHLKP